MPCQSFDIAGCILLKNADAIMRPVSLSMIYQNRRKERKRFISYGAGSRRLFNCTDFTSRRHNTAAQSDGCANDLENRSPTVTRNRIRI